METADYKLSDLEANPENPRTITDEQLEALRNSMKVFGDLSGIVFCRKSKKLVGGHQRCKAAAEPDAKVHITQRLDKPDQHGTVALGYIETRIGNFSYREVQWDKQIETMAMIAANNHGGDWEKKLLQNAIASLDEETDFKLVGYTEKQIQKVMQGWDETPVSGDLVKDLENQGSENPLTADQMMRVPSHVRMIQLFFNEATQKRFLEACKMIQMKHPEAKNVSDAALAAVEAYATPNSTAG